MAAVASCPAVQELEQFLLGQLPEPGIAGLQQHLATCSRCLDTVNSLKVRDTLVEAIQEAPTIVEPAEAVVVQNLIGRLRLLPAFAESPSAEEHRYKGDAGADLAESAAATIGLLSPAQAADEIGRLGGYRVLRVLGAGGMGVVFAAEDPQLRRAVALKVLKPTLAAKPDSRRRFLREAQAAAALDHPNIITIHQVGEDRGVPFLAMQLLYGETLEQRLQRGPAPPLSEAVHIGRQIADGLAAAHAAGLIHRDIKPGNIWLESVVSSPWSVVKDTETAVGTATDYGPRSTVYRVKILDFGLARPEQDDQHLTQSDTLVGTPAYMAPEQARGEQVDRRCDLFSLGCVLYHLCTGRKPFSGTNTTAVLLSLTLDQPRPPREINPHIPPTLDDLILRLLSKQPAERVTAQAAADTLRAVEQEFFHQEPIPARPFLEEKPSPTEPAAPSTTAAMAGLAPARSGAGVVPGAGSRRRRYLLVAAAVVFLILGPLGYFFGGTIIRFASNQGELVVEINDPTIEVQIKQDKLVVRQKTSQREFILAAGAGEIEVYEKDGIELTTKKFTLTRAGKTTVSVTQEVAAARTAWTAGAPLPDSRGGLMAASLDGLLYVAGGHIPQEPKAEVLHFLDVYDPKINRWRRLASLPKIVGDERDKDGKPATGEPGRYEAALSVLENKLYLAGGWRVDPPLPTDSLLIYDPQANKWETGPKLPRRMGNCVSGVINGKLYVRAPWFGFDTVSPFLYVFDPAAKSWNNPDVQSWKEVKAFDRIDGRAGGVLGGKFYLVGGLHVGKEPFQVTGAVHVYDPITNMWQSKAPMPTPRAALAVAVAGGKLYALGGYAGNLIPLATVEVYDPASNRWSAHAPLPTPRFGLAAAVVGNTLYALGGFGTGQTPLAVVETLTLTPLAAEKKAP